MDDAVAALYEQHDRAAVGQVGLNDLLMRRCRTKVGNVRNTHSVGKIAKVLPAV